MSDIHSNGGLSATYSPRTQRLLLLRGDANDGWVQLTGIDLLTGVVQNFRAASVNTGCEEYRIREGIAGGLWVTANLGSSHTVAQVDIGQGGWSQPVVYAAGEVRAADSDFLVDERGLSLPLSDGTVQGFRLDDLNSNVSERCF